MAPTLSDKLSHNQRDVIRKYDQQNKWGLNRDQNVDNEAQNLITKFNENDDIDKNKVNGIIDQRRKFFYELFKLNREENASKPTAELFKSDDPFHYYLQHQRIADDDTGNNQAKSNTNNSVHSLVLGRDNSQVIRRERRRLQTRRHKSLVGANFASAHFVKRLVPVAEAADQPQPIDNDQLDLRSSWAAGNRIRAELPAGSGAIVSNDLTETAATTTSFDTTLPQAVGLIITFLGILIAGVALLFWLKSFLLRGCKVKESPRTLSASESHKASVNEIVDIYRRPTRTRNAPPPSLVKRNCGGGLKQGETMSQDYSLQSTKTDEKVRSISKHRNSDGNDDAADAHEVEIQSVPLPVAVTIPMPIAISYSPPPHQTIGTIAAEQIFLQFPPFDSAAPRKRQHQSRSRFSKLKASSVTGLAQTTTAAAPPINRLRRISSYERGRQCERPVTATGHNDEYSPSNREHFDYVRSASSSRSKPLSATADDKENAKPFGSAELYSPKMKQSENALAQQNSPRHHYDSPPHTTRFSFSPKSITNTSPPPPQSQSPLITEGRAATENTPQQPHQHGNYFRFPEVDCLTPDSAVIQSTDMTTAAQQATRRRARLKSISLDSDGAKLVEENLGIPVEELLIEVTQQPDSPAGDQECIVATEYDDEQKKQTEPYDYKKMDSISIDICEDDDSKPLMQPKTPTLAHIKHKAASLDLSATMIVSSDVKATNRLVENQMPPSLSVSVPNTPKRSDIYTAGYIRRKRQSASGITSASTIPPQHTTKLESFDESQCDDDGDDNDNHDDEDELVLADHELCGAVQTSANQLVAAPSNIQPPSSILLLSLSSNNLKTLPEVMTLSNFYDDDTNWTAAPAAKEKHQPSVLQRRSSNHNLTKTAGGSLGNLSKLSISSNYTLMGGSSSSISNQQTQRCHQQQLPPERRYRPEIITSTSVADISSKLYQTSTTTITTENCSSTLLSSIATHAIKQTSINNMMTPSAGKKNLLQRRGSNTSLTLNIRQECSNLNRRFNSQSSLSSQQSQQPLQQQRENQRTQPMRKGGGVGLLERRNSNASLTLNITQTRALSVSNCSLRSSYACSQSSINSNVEKPEEAVCIISETSARKPSHLAVDDEEYFAISTTSSPPSPTQYRKFYSSENLHGYQPLRTKLNQTHARNSTRTCFGSVSDLKPTSATTDESITSNNGELCSCTGLRNITTKPLSPQATSEDFKMYLANIQMLQSASNSLNADHLRQLGCIFEKSYESLSPRAMAIIGKSKTFADDIRIFPNSGGDGVGAELKRCSLLDNGDTSAAPITDEEKCWLRNLHLEFWDLPTNYQEKPLVFGSQIKNRYKSILPNEHSRVVLKILPAGTEDSVQTVPPPYINANFIKGPDYTKNAYIATQGPLPNTLYEFWLMVFENIEKIKRPQPVQKIAMLTNFYENGRPKCAKYFPVNTDCVMKIDSLNGQLDILLDDAEGEEIISKFFNSRNYCLPDDEISGREQNKGDMNFESNRKDEHDLSESNFFLILNVCTIPKNGYTIRELVCAFVTQELSQRFNVQHYWFPDWPDHHSPNDLNALVDMSLHLLDDPSSNELTEGDASPLLEMEDLETPFPIIHCSAGIGRTGCLAAILNGLRQMRVVHKHGDSQSVHVDVLAIVCNLRLQRGGMVQNSEQYELIHRILCLYQKRLDQENSTNSTPATAAKLSSNRKIPRTQSFSEIGLVEEQTTKI